MQYIHVYCTLGALITSAAPRRSEGAIIMSLSLHDSVHRLLNPWSVAAAATALFAGQLLAADQSSTSASENSLEEVVVTAQFRQQNLQDTPLAITAVNADMMEQRGQTSLHDLSQQAPNVALVETGGA